MLEYSTKQLHRIVVSKYEKGHFTEMNNIQIV